MRIDIIAAGKLRNDPLSDEWHKYKKRLQWSLTLHEIDTEKQILEKIKPEAYLIALDEKGKSLRSLEFSQKLEDLSLRGQTHVQFVIGPADGLSKKLRDQADFLLSFGIQTWPHKLVRVMLIEQLYRAQQITAGHPYHRE